MGSKSKTAPPSTLKADGKKFWKQVLTEYELDACHDLRRLEMAGRCLDDIALAEAALTAEGHFIEDRFQQRREHPAQKTVRDNRTLFCRIVRELALDLDQLPERSRPPRMY